MTQQIITNATPNAHKLVPGQAYRFFFAGGPVRAEFIRLEEQEVKVRNASGALVAHTIRVCHWNRIEESV